MLIFVAVVGFSLSGWLSPSNAAPRLKIATTIFPLYDLVRQVAGPEVEVVLLVPAGASPHTMAVTPSLIRSLTGSAALFAIGHGLDDWAVRLAADAGVNRTIFVDDRLLLRTGHEHEHGFTSAHHETPAGKVNVDPHYWLAIPNAIQMVKNIADALGKLDAVNPLAYTQRAAAYIQVLHATDAAIRQTFVGVSRREIALFHAAFDYFAAAYDVHIVATFEPTPGQEPGPQHVLGFLRRVREHNLRVLFVEPQSHAGALRSLARDLGVTLQELDPLGGGRGRESYIALMQFNAAQLVSVLRK